MFRFDLLLALLLFGPPWGAQAHNTGNSFLTLDLLQEPAVLRWDIALRDLDALMDLDADQDGALSWGEVRVHHAEIAARVKKHLAVRSRDGSCNLVPGEQALAERADGAYAVLPLVAGCGGRRPTGLHYDLFFDLDSNHRGLLRVVADAGEQLVVLSPQRRSVELSPQGWWANFAGYWRHGVWHIWIGLDHVLFLLTLLLPAALQREASSWRPRPSLRGTLGEVAAVVTAFTLAHSLTLSLAVLGVLPLPGHLVEPAIAVTLVLATLNNLRPFLPGPRWSVAFCLGLIHGLGFAAALQDLGLPAVQLAAALAGFNLGVESGQLAIVAMFVPPAFLLRNWRPYRTAAVHYGSAAVAVIAFGWLAERVSGVDFMGF
jgi:hypothetical protein